MVPTKEVRLIDSLNGKAYAYRYRSLDSSYKYANEAYRQGNFYKSGKAEASNNLGFCAFMAMDFDRAEALHKEVYKLTKNELELLIADIGLMKICQRTAMNKEFYDYRNSALKRMKRIREESDLFADRHEALRLDYAFTEFFIVSSIYYYYLQQRQEAITSLNRIPEDEALTDTNQLLYYHYIKGSASLVEATKPEDRKMREFDQLYITWRTAVQTNHPYFEGNGLQGLANLMVSPNNFELFRTRRGYALDQFGFPVDSLLPLRMAQRALEKFREYNDLYQIAGAYVSIGKYMNEHGRYTEALDTLAKALDCVNQHHMLYYHHAADTLDKLHVFVEGDTTYTGVPWIMQEDVRTVPEWISRIREQLSVSYAGLGMKYASDYNRNIYLDILNYTRQDKELESRYLSLEADSRQMTLVLSLVIVGLVLVVILWWFFNKRSKIRNQVDVERLQRILTLCRDITSSIPMNVPLIQQGIDQLFGKGRLQLEIPEEGKAALVPLHRLNRDEKALVHVLEPYIVWAADNEQMVEALSDERMQLEKQRYVYEQHIAGNKRQNLIKKACLAIVNGINPYIDRILNEVHKLTERGYIDNAKIKKEKYQYIDELVTTINEYNDILALWIKMKQGTLSLNIETFSLNELFELLGKGRRAFEMKNQKLEIEPTTVMVKADRALTLFMINTLAENARKYTPEGGTIKVYARITEDAYVEISVEDNGRGISEEDVAHIIGEKVYDSRVIGMKNAADPEVLKENKGSGFGLMNCKGIIEKYKKTNDLFRGCVFDVESELGKGSRFYFRLPSGVRKAMGVLLLCLLLPLGMVSCLHDPIPPMLQDGDSIVVVTDSAYEDLLDVASDYANAAYFANVDENYELALQYIDSAMLFLNEHYEKYARPDRPHRYMKLVGEGTPAEISWWNELFDSDYHVILDIRNEASVAFLALKQLDAYSYNNSAFTDLYKLQGEDQTLEAYCRQLERSNTNKTVGIILCFVLLIVSLVGYYFLYMRKRLQNRLNLEQVLEINQKVFAASLVRPQEQENAEALQREESMLKEIPQRIVDEAFGSVNELLTIDRMGIAVYNETTHRLEYASRPGQEMPEMVEQCFSSGKYLSEQHLQAIPLMVEAGSEHQCVGVLYLERREGTEQETDRLLFELVARYVAIVVFNAVVKLATKYRDIESAHEETRRASWEDSMLHVQNMVLDNCLSTIKHETIYYPNKIKQIVGRLNTQKLSETEEREAVETMTELIEYYKGIFTILSSCASRQLEEVTFRRTVIPVQELLDAAGKYFKKLMKNRSERIELEIESMEAKVIGDVNQLRFLLENLIDEALTVREDGVIRLQARKDNEYIRFLFTDTRREKSVEELNQLFYPNLARMTSGEKGELRGTEYLVCKQIIRDHDEFAGRRGCRINAEPAEGGGFTVYFTIPRR
ncbi:histidine kinase-, DNA gyrase B-, and HSP90-like ATPase family protein [Bacteroides ovatus str. 3725 D9 iii]|nr:histidine kinase-, DNA gyrase B-, and HSP90-like ATPase family protein [Bacteroides ovatus str. 3725 D9 iii]KDS13797.1 histidine kinase-, DNA gyrase B-, and HSP90-like ATPase family protein [Bacteroides ovatus str. 3725 D1 iv]